MADTEGFVVSVGFYTPFDFTMTDILIRPSPWVGPTGMGAKGFRPETSEPVLLIAEDTPLQFSIPDGRFSKESLERLHVLRFNADQRMATGQALGEELRQGANPPDLECVSGSNSFGIECTQLGAPGRREVNAFFRSVREALEAAPMHYFGGLLGASVQISFGDSSRDIGRPFRRTDFASAEALIEAMNGYRLNIDDFKSDELPSDRLPSGPLLLGEVPGRDTYSRVYANPLLNGAPDSYFYSVRGFEVVLGYASGYTKTDAEVEVRRLVDQHDKPGVDVLLIAVGAPDRAGLSYPSDTMFGTFYLECGDPITKPKHIDRVVMHLWDSGEVWDIVEAKRKLFGPLYSGVSPAHRTWSNEVTSVRD
ncbi:hypothetical protein [Lentzea sp. NPDC004782]|uniref:hypothetical protein n=1 Tax=Lentzea sp. NPDC004782 TaxID=3154458 RepID=UPI0033BBC774